MSSNIPKGAKVRPSWGLYHKLGVRIMRDCALPKGQTFTAIAQRVGGTKQDIYNECAVALGKVAFRLRQQCQDSENLNVL